MKAVYKYSMNFKEWKTHTKFNINTDSSIWYWRNAAVKYFELKSGEVIHHLMDTDEQKEFNNKYYERWGFDLNGEMKYCVKMTKVEHDTYHSSLRKGKHNTQEHNLKVSESLKQLYATPEGKALQQSARKKYWERENAHEHQSEKLKQYFSKQENREKLSNSMKGLQLWTDGEKRIWAHECPEGYVKAESPTKGRHWHQKNKERYIRCIETGDIVEIHSIREKYPKAGHAGDVANGIRKIARWLSLGMGKLNKNNKHTKGGFV